MVSTIVFLSGLGLPAAILAREARRVADGTKEGAIVFRAPRARTWRQVPAEGARILPGDRMSDVNAATWKVTGPGVTEGRHHGFAPEWAAVIASL